MAQYILPVRFWPMVAAQILQAKHPTGELVSLSSSCRIARLACAASSPGSRGTCPSGDWVAIAGRRVLVLPA